MSIPPTREAAPGVRGAGWWRVALAVVLLVTARGAFGADHCLVAPEQAGLHIPIGRLDLASRCMIATVVNDYTTSGLVGPVQTPIAQDFFTYLLDHPVLLGALVERLGLGHYRFALKGEGRYWVDDGDGTQGMLTVVYRDPSVRIYHLDGYHEGSVFPMVKAKAVVFMGMVPVTAPDGHPSVESRLVAYTKLTDTVLAALVRLLRPLVGGAVTRKLSRGFDVTYQLGALIAQDPQRVAREATGLDGIDEADRKALATLLQAVPPPPLPVQPARSTP